MECLFLGVRCYLFLIFILISNYGFCQNNTLSQERYTYKDSLVAQKDAIINLPNLIFQPGTHYLYDKAGPELDKLRDFMFQNPSVIIEIQGHICCRRNGEDGFDPETLREDLSVQRAKKVYEYLIQLGISKERMTYVGFGGSKKIIKDDFTNSEAAQINMRVDIKIISE